MQIWRLRQNILPSFSRFVLTRKCSWFKRFVLLSSIMAISWSQVSLISSSRASSLAVRDSEVPVTRSIPLFISGTLSRIPFSVTLIVSFSVVMASSSLERNDGFYRSQSPQFYKSQSPQSWFKLTLYTFNFMAQCHDLWGYQFSQKVLQYLYLNSLLVQWTHVFLLIGFAKNCSQ